MIFKETDRTTIIETYRHAVRAEEVAKGFKEQFDKEYDEGLEKLNDIMNTIEELSGNVAALTQTSANIVSVLQDLGNTLRAIRDFSRADGEVNKSQLEVIIAGVELITNMLETQKVTSPLDEIVVDDIPVIRVAKPRRRRFATVHNRYRSHR